METSVKFLVCGPVGMKADLPYPPLIPFIGKNTFRHVQEYVKDIILVTDDEIKRLALARFSYINAFDVDKIPIDY